MSARPIARARSRWTVRRGHSLVELLVAVGIIGLLIGLMVTAYSQAISATRQAAATVSQATIDLAALSGTPLHVPAPPAPQEGGAAGNMIPDQYILEFAPSAASPRAEAERLVAAYPGGRILHVYNTPEMKGCSVLIPRIKLSDLEALPAVRSVEQDRYCYGAAEITPTGVRRMGLAANQRRQLPKRSPGSVGLPAVSGGLLKRATNAKLIIAVIDSGVDPAHPDLNVGFATAFGPFAPDANDGIGHGTHVAGIIAARANGQGVVGVVPGAVIWNIRVLDATPPAGVGATSDIIAGVNFVRNNADKIRVANMSLGVTPVSPLLNSAVNQCVTAGIIMCVSAGNSSANASAYSPASASGVVCVAALADSDGKFGGQGGATSAGADDTFATFSNFGNVVDVIAPGVDILSTVPVSMGSYASKNGTSMAAPHVSGLMALYGQSTVGNRAARGLEIAAMLAQQGSVELISGPGGRSYPLLLDRLSKKP